MTATPQVSLSLHQCVSFQTCCCPLGHVLAGPPGNPRETARDAASEALGALLTQEPWGCWGEAAQAASGTPT